MKTAFTILATVLLLTGCASTAPEKTGTINLPPVEYVK